MRLETILRELKEKKRALESAIMALESLQKNQRRSDTRTFKRAKSAVRTSKNRRRVSEIGTQVLGSGGGQVLPFPSVRRTSGGRRRSEEIKA